MTENELKVMAGYEYLYIESKTVEHGSVFASLNDKISTNGALTCFCKREMENGESADKVYAIDVKNIHDLRVPICKYQDKYVKTIGLPSAIYYSISIIIVLQSLVVRISSLALTKFITYKSESMRTNVNTLIIFLIYFNNLGVTYLLAPMLIHIPILDYFFDGIYPDFNKGWFQDFGALIVIA